MRIVSISFVLVLGVLVTSACNKKNQDIGQTPTGAIALNSASTSEGPATVTMTDGSRYWGALVSKNGSQMTFRGDNGATRTLDSRDIQSIRMRADSSESNAAIALTEPARVIIPSGTRISVRNNEAINSSTASAGQTFSAVVASDVVDDKGAIMIARGSAAMLVVRHAGAGKIHANDLALQLTSLAVRGVPRGVQTGMFFQKGRDGVGGNRRTALFTGGGAAVGALIGGLAGGGKGAGIGAASGAGAGAGTQLLTRGSVKIGAESLMSFTLHAPLAL
jgi:hypothetical protein